jgi:hypothetical protein
MYIRLICNLYALLRWQNFILVKSGCYSYSPKLNSLQDLGIRFKAMVTEEVVDDAGLLVDGGMQHRLSASLSLHRVLDLLDPLHL